MSPNSIPATDRSALEAMLKPRGVAVVGASVREGTLGNNLIRRLSGAELGGNVFPVNPRYEEIEGWRCFPSLAAIEGPVDCVALCVPDRTLEDLLREAAAAGVRAAFIPSRCYEPGDAPRPQLAQRLGPLARELGIAICGINCMGFVNYGRRLIMSGNPPPIPDEGGHVGLVSHSGSTWSGLVGNQRDVPFAYAISVGSETTTTIGDYMHFLLDQPEVRVIAAVVETVRDPANFRAALGRAAEKGVPVVALTLGRSEKGKGFGIAHSGAIAGADGAYEALFDHYGVIRARSLDAMLDSVEMFRTARRPRGRVVGMVTDSGGERQLISDIAEEVGLPLGEFSPLLKRRLEEALDPGMTGDNPVDTYADGAFLLGPCLDIIAKSGEAAVAVAATNLVAGRSYVDQCVEAVAATHEATDVPVALFGNMHATVSRAGAAALRAKGIPVLMGTATALSALRDFLGWHGRRERPAEVAPAAAAALAEDWRRRLAGLPAGPLDAGTGMALLTAFGVPVAPHALASTADEAVAAARRIGLPVAMKSGRADLVHKTEAGALRLGLAEEAAVREAADDLLARFGAPLLVQRQMKGSAEIFLGMVADPQFGPIVQVGLGGIFVEVLRDVVHLVPPFGPDRLAGRLAKLKGYPLLTGARGRAPVDLPAVLEAAVRFGTLAAALGESFSELEINPLIAGPDGCAAVDVVAVAK